MKKLFLILIMASTAASAWAQSQLSTVRGKTKDGKSIKVDYYQGAVEDVIQSVKYQLVDELQASVKELQGRSKTLQEKLDGANKEINLLNNRVKELENNKPVDNSAELKKAKASLAAKEKEVAELNAEIQMLNKRIEELGKNDMSETVSSLHQQLTEKETQNSTLSEQIAAKEKEVTDLNTEIRVLNNRIDELGKIDISETVNSLHQQLTEKENQNSSLSKQLATKEATINDLNRQLADRANGSVAKPVNTPVVGIEVCFGPAFAGKTVGKPWAKDVKTSLQADAYFGTARLAENFPVSIEVGLGIHKFGMSASLNEYDMTNLATDIDGDNYTGVYSYSDLAENLSLTYFNIPIRLCFGQPAKDRVTVYAKLGLTPSINVASNFEGTGKYDLKGYYPHWNVTLEDIEELGFGSNLEAYKDVEAEINGFNIWGNFAFGAYVPFKGSPVVLNAGVKLDYPFMNIGSINGTEKLPDGTSGLLQQGAVVIPSIEVGLVYTIK